MIHHHSWVRRAILVLPVLLLFSIMGCGGHNPRRVHTFYGIDTSASYHEYLEGSLELTADFASRLQGDDLVTVYRMDSDCWEMYNNKAPNSAEDMLADLREKVKTPQRYPGTYPDKFWSTVDERISQAAKSQDVFGIVLCSDSDEDSPDPAAQATIRVAAEHLAANPHVAFVVFCGVRDENRAAIRAAFHAFSEDRLFIYGFDDINTDDLIARLDQSR